MCQFFVRKILMPKRKIIKRDITKEQFHALIRRAAQPIEPNESDLELLETLEHSSRRWL